MGDPKQLSYAGRAPFMYGNPPRGYDSQEAALKELHDRAVTAEAAIRSAPVDELVALAQWIDTNFDMGAEHSQVADRAILARREIYNRILWRIAELKENA